MATTTTINDIPVEDLNKIKARVLEHVNSMTQDEMQIAAKSKEALAKTIGLLFQEVAKVFGYIITYPVLLAVKVADSFIKGLADGSSKAWDDVFGD